MVAGVIALLLFFGLSVNTLVDAVTKVAIERDAEQKASFYSEHIQISEPDLAFMLLDGQISNQDADVIRNLAKIGDVFQFELFDTKANLILSSSDSESHATDEPGQAHRSSAIKSLISGEISTYLDSWTNEAGAKNCHAQVFIPLRDKHRNIIGALGVFIDQTAIAHSYRTMFTALVLALFAMLALAFYLPFLAFIRKTRQEQASSKRADYLAKYDQVVDLLNRKGLLNKIDERYQSGHLDFSKLAVIFLDIDYFKSINDEFGHKAGDGFLTHVGDCITATLGPQDLAGRLGGDEFMLVIQRDTEAEINQFSENLQHLIAIPALCDGATIMGHASIGVDYPQDLSISLEDRMRRADFALYRAKQDGRNLYRIFTEDMEDEAKRRRSVEAAILSGQEDDRFEVYFQPLLHKQSKEVAGFEALLRLRDEDGTLISPTEFIPIAEDMGQIPALGQLVLEKSLRAAQNWPEQLYVSVNLSAQQFKCGTLVSSIRTLLQETNTDPARLELEMTESLLMENTEAVSSQLDDIRDLGISLAMDDFGTGYSSLGYLWQFGFDKLKIDRSFISGLKSNPEKMRDILATIIILGHRMDMTVTVEGIETEEQEQQIKDLSFDYLQGYLYSRPLPETELAAYLLGQMVERNDLIQEEISTVPGQVHNIG